MDRVKLRKKLLFLIRLHRLRRISNLARKKQARRYWVRDILRHREGFGTFHTLFEELTHDREYFFRFLRMTPERFDHLLGLVRPKIEKNNTNFRKAIKAEERLALTL